MKVKRVTIAAAKLSLEAIYDTAHNNDKFIDEAVKAGFIEEDIIPVLADRGRLTYDSALFKFRYVMAPANFLLHGNQVELGAKWLALKHVNPNHLQEYYGFGGGFPINKQDLEKQYSIMEAKDPKVAAAYTDWLAVILKDKSEDSPSRTIYADIPWIGKVKP